MCKLFNQLPNNRRVLCCFICIHIICKFLFCFVLFHSSSFSYICLTFSICQTFLLPVYDCIESTYSYSSLFRIVRLVAHTSNFTMYMHKLQGTPCISTENMCGLLDFPLASAFKSLPFPHTKQQQQQQFLHLNIAHTHTKCSCNGSDRTMSFNKSQNSFSPNVQRHLYYYIFINEIKGKTRFRQSTVVHAL